MTEALTNIFIVGHRGTGKSTTARLAGQLLGLEVVDLDEVIEEREDRSCADIIDDSEPHFRRLERRYLAEIVERPADGARIISLGAGFHPLPTRGACIWLYRDGWQEVARDGRARLRPDMDFAAEVDWMIGEREPRWEEGAHLRLHVPRGRGPQRVAQDLSTSIRWLCELPDSPLAARTWVVAATDSQLQRAARDAALFGFAGVEVRSDLVDAERAGELPARVLASLRTDEPRWLASQADAAAFDVDVKLLDEVIASAVLSEISPRPLLISAHPTDSSQTTASQLIDRARRLSELHPDWDDHLVLKWAPQIANYEDLLDALTTHQKLLEGGRPVTFLPQAERFAWTRPALLRQNATNYVPVGIAPHRRRHTTNPVATPLDLQAWLPHLAGPPPEAFEALIGDPVATSQGDLWHRRAARRKGMARSYVKIPFGRDESPRELDLLLRACEDLDIHGLSVTSPLKQRVLESERLKVSENLSAVNTLRYDADRDLWEATDTDEAGMMAILEHIEKCGAEPGDIAIIGRGGVSPAVLRAIDDSDWTLAHHASGRAGWSDEAPDSVAAVINAAGNADSAYENPPRSIVWIDLHYSGVRPCPDWIEHHFNGDQFFDAQARAQREFWCNFAYAFDA